jgi:uncharacterized protein (DUF1015 family)
MVDFLPFRGLRYNTPAAGNMKDLVAPPYDVISSKEQEELYARHPNNIIRLILNKTRSQDCEGDNCHSRAAGYLNRWIEEQILIQDDAAGFYLTAIDFNHKGRSVIRYGIIGIARLMNFDEGVILPHEKTFSKVKSERLSLMKACHANLCPIFGLYADSGEIFAYLTRISRELKPVVEFTDSQGMGHSVRRITDPEHTRFIVDSLRERKLYIADGHHRYETALSYRDWYQELRPGMPKDHPANFVMMSISSIEDPGMIILPAHRLLRGVALEASSELVVKAEKYFNIHTFPLKRGIENALTGAHAEMEKHLKDNAIAVHMPSREDICVLVLKPGVMSELFATELPGPLRDLDVTVLTRLIIEELLGVAPELLDNEKKIAYVTDSREAIRRVQEGDADVAFILNSTRIEQVKQVSENGLIMPRKSTYFYPKVISGLVLHSLRPGSGSGR